MAKYKQGPARSSRSSDRTYPQYGNTYGGYRGASLTQAKGGTCPSCGEKLADGCMPGCTDRD